MDNGRTDKASLVQVRNRRAVQTDDCLQVETAFRNIFSGFVHTLKKHQKQCVYVIASAVSLTYATY